MTENTLETAQDALSQAAGNASYAARTLTRLFQRRRAEVIGQIDGQREAVVGYVRDNPGRTVGVAALVGLALGVLLMRR